MESPYVIWGWLNRPKSLSDKDVTNLKQYFSSNNSGGGEITNIAKEESSKGTLLRIEYKETHVVQRVLNRSHNLDAIIGPGFTNADFHLSKTRPVLSLTANQIVESDDENVQSYVFLDSKDSSPATSEDQSLPTTPEFQIKEKSDVCSQDEELTNKVVVEVYEFPTKSLDELIEEVIYHFTLEPFYANTLTSPADAYDRKSKTIKLEFSKSDAEEILKNEIQNLLGEEAEKIRLRQCWPPKSCAVLITSTSKISSDKVIKTEFKRFGDIKEIRRMDDANQKFLIIYCQHEAAVNAEKEGAVTITGKQVNITLWNEPLENTESAAESSVPSSPESQEFKTNRVQVSCQETNSPNLVAIALKSFGKVTSCTKHHEPNTFVVEFSESTEAYKAAAKRTFTSEQRTFSIELHKESFSKADCLNIQGDMLKRKAEDEPAKVFADGSAKVSGEGFVKVSQNSTVLVTHLSDVDSYLLGHWMRAVTGIWPLSCIINGTKDKAVVKMPSLIDVTMFSKASEEEYFLHGSLIATSILHPTTKMLAEFDKIVQIEHHDGVRLYFDSPQCGLKTGQIVSLVPFGDSQKAFIITYSEHKAIQEIIQRVNHSFMGYRIEVGEFYPAAGYCRSSDLMVFPSRKREALPDKNIVRLVVKNISEDERSHFELLMKNKRTGGDNSANFSYSEKEAHVSYNDCKVTNAVYKTNIDKGIFLNDKKLEMDLETTELTEIHDHKAVRLSGLPDSIDPERLKFYLSDISKNLVTSILFQENGDRAVAFFKNTIDMKLLYSDYQAIKLQGCERMKIQPQLKSTSILVALRPNVNQEFLVLAIEDISPPCNSFRMKPLADVESAWIVSVSHTDIERLSSELSKRKELSISNYSDFLGTKVTKGIQRRSFLLSDIVKEEILLHFLLDNQLPGYKRLLKLVQNYDCEMSDNGMISMNIDSQKYTSFIKRWDELKAQITTEMTTSWCVSKSIILPEEITEEFNHTLLLYNQKVRLSCEKESLIIAGEKKDVEETVSAVSRAIKEMDDKKREERETGREILKLKDYEFAYLDLLNELSELKVKYPVKELSLDNSNFSLVIHANKKYINDVKKAVTDITSSLCESTVSKSEMFIKKCESEFARQKILENLKANHLLAVCVPERTKITAYAKTRDIAQMALKCIDEVVWEVKYPDGRTFDADEKTFLQKSQDLWKKAKRDLISKDSSVDIIEALDDTCFVIIGYGKSNQKTVLNEIIGFFNKFLPKTTLFAGNKFHKNYISRYMNSELKMIEQNTNATVSCKKDEISLTGSDDQIFKAEELLRSLHDKIINDKHKVEVDFHIEFLLNESEVIEDLGKACQTLIVLENGDELRKRVPEPSKLKSTCVLQIHITQRTTLHVKNNEIHEILDCDGLVIPTSRNLRLSELNGPFAKYIEVKGGVEVFNECLSSKEAVKSGRRLLPGSILTTSAGEFRKLTKIIHMVLADWSRPDNAVNVLEKCLKSAFIKAREQGILALLIPMSSFPEDYDYDMVIRTLIKTIKAFGDDLPSRIVLLETQITKIKDLKSSLNEEFKSVRADPEPDLQMPSTTAGSNLGTASSKHSKSTMGSQASNNELKKLSGTQLLIGACKFTVEKGLLQESQQQVIVNSTGTSISLQENPLARALNDAAGPGLQEECKTLAPLNEGEVKVSKAYNLKCKHILHCRINGTYAGIQSEKDLTGLIIECLHKVDQELQLTSVAFPALGTGVLKYPAHVVANCLINGLKEYSSRNTVKHLKEVVAVIFHSDSSTYKAFLDTIEKGDRKCQNQDTSTVSPVNERKMQQSNQETLKNVTWDASLSLNNTVIAVQQGDILQYTGKAIVCPTNKQFHNAGALAAKLMKDPYIENEAKQANLNEMRSDGLCLIRTCPGKVEIANYRAEYIFFVDSKSHMDSVVKRCLEKCQSNRIESISFPFIGAGLDTGGEPAEKKAKNLLTAAIEFVNSNGDGTLKNIDFIIFGSMPFKMFQTALNELKEQPSILGLLAGAIKSFGSWLGPGYVKETKPAPSISPYEDSKALHMTIYGVEQAQIKATKRKLNERLEKETVTIQWDSLVNYEEEKHLIAKLTSEQAKNLMDAAKCMGVVFTLDQDLMNIQISGSKTVIYDYRDLVKKELQEVENAIFTRKLQEYQSSNFKWSFRQEQEEKWRDFDWEDSHSLESHFKLIKTGVLELNSKQFKNSLRIDFGENSFRLHASKYFIRRVDKTLCFPNGWDENAGEQAEVPLIKGSDEYKAVEANFLKTIKNANAAVLEVIRVQHLSAYKQYMEQRRLVAFKLKKPEDQVERVPLWHGSTEDTVLKIAKSFFNRSYSGKNATVYGKGSYFARDSSYSANDTYSRPNSAGEKYMFQVRVIIGEYAVGNTNMVDCPLKQDGTAYNSAVDNVDNPSIFVVFHDTAAYPEYIIKFRM